MSIEILEVYVFTLKLPDTRLHKFFDILNRFQLGKNQVFILLLRWTVCKTLTKQAQRHKTATSKLVSKKELNLKNQSSFRCLGHLCFTSWREYTRLDQTLALLLYILTSVRVLRTPYAVFWPATKGRCLLPANYNFFLCLWHQVAFILSISCSLIQPVSLLHTFLLY